MCSAHIFKVAYSAICGALANKKTGTARGTLTLLNAATNSTA